MFTTVLGLLLLASASGWLLQQRRPQLSLPDYSRRLRAWWLVTLAVLVMMAAPPPGGALLLALLVLQALRECRDALWSGPRRLLLLAVPWLLLSMAFPLLLLMDAGSAGRLLFCWILLLTQLNDILQYFAGKACGRYRMAPHISPGKTWEGGLGGLLGTTLLSLLFTPLLLRMSLPAALGFGVLVAVGGVAGDLLFSWFKRRAGIKDFGQWLPGQGGVLDRLDSLTCTAPLCVVYTWLLSGG